MSYQLSKDEYLSNGTNVSINRGMGSPLWEYLKHYYVQRMAKHTVGVVQHYVRWCMHKEWHTHNEWHMQGEVSQYFDSHCILLQVVL